MKKIVTSVLFTALSMPAVSATTPDIKEGLWEVRTQANIPGMPVELPAQTVQQCFTKQSMNPKNILQNSSCKMQDMDIQANSVKWKMTCQQQGMQLHGGGDIQYQKTSFVGTTTMIMQGGPQGSMTMQAQITGRYIGKCR
ncbi:MAG: hypothetical protein methR_P1421 [Methyloprofundus sp.]|nr:MAG: hypothetical protein methR_P1421 [Methyloprofundus sp.]